MSAIDTQSITNRELEVLQCIAEGFTNLEIGAQMHLSPETVKTYRFGLFRKLQARNMAHLVHISHCLGLLIGPGQNIFSPDLKHN